MDAVRVLLEHGADVNLKCHGTPPIHLAVATAIQPNGEAFGFDSLAFMLEKEANVLAKVFFFVICIFTCLRWV